MKALLTIAVFGLLGGSAFAGSTTLQTASGTVKASIDVAGNESATVSDIGYAPGDAFDAFVTIKNDSEERVILSMPFLGVRYPAQNVATQRQLWSYSATIAIDAGATFHETLHGYVPRDADVGSNMKVGFVIGISGQGGDLHRAFASFLIVRGVTDNTGGNVGTIVGSGSALRRRVGGSGGDSNQAPAPRRDPDPNLPTRRHR
jgi:hypothetical protein